MHCGKIKGHKGRHLCECGYRKWKRYQYLMEIGSYYGIWMLDFIILTERWVTSIHKGQMYGNKPYIVHLKGVADKLKDKRSKIVALLHDSVEDGKTTLKEISKRFGNGIAIDIDALTRRNNEGYDAYIKRVSEASDTAKEVKIADLEYNLEQTDGLKGSLKPRYQKALKILRGALK